MNYPLVTVFIPVYNSEEYLQESLKSITSQTYKNMEILLVDDGSTDSSIDIINSFEDSRIKLIENPGNKGIPYTRNVGLREAKGKYMAIMDSDDISMPNRIQEQVDYLETHPSIDALGTFYIKFDQKNEKKITTEFISSEDVKASLLFHTPISNPSSIVRLESIKEIGLMYNPDFFVSQDYGFWAELSKAGKLEILPKYLLKYRTGHENITKVSKRDKLLKRKGIIKRIQSDLLEHYKIPLKPKEKEIFSEFFSQNPEKLYDDKIIGEVINKLKTWSENTDLVDESVFLKILDHNISVAISNQKISLLQKIKLYFSFTSSTHLKQLEYLVAKHLYYKFKR